MEIVHQAENQAHIGDIAGKLHEEMRLSDYIVVVSTCSHTISPLLHRELLHGILTGRRKAWFLYTVKLISCTAVADVFFLLDRGQVLQ